MDAPGRPHVRIYGEFVYIERVPNAWVQVVLVADWYTMNEHERTYMVDKALKKSADFELPRE